MADRRAGSPRLSNGDLGAVLWAVACCWVAVGGNYLLIAAGLTAAYIVPFDLFVIPAVVTAGFWLVDWWRG